ncbi:20684_t:CDS:2 [Dentiscutata erythropus]|uniref:20684_t:CDS:1 n=1 Tax=Dentiscutata erythropus TaxID=1348616 RepID=A0A9N9H2P9_9GLOM|nr:20684_t:CDS:2 [Dentiscutata erythropus]
MASRNSETASNTFSISENEPQEYSETNETNESSQSLTKRINIGGKKQEDIWLYVNQGISLGRDIIKLVVNIVLFHGKEILENHMSVISNTAVFDLLEDEDFYIKCHQISVILKPVKELTNCLEAKTANLADVFIDLILTEFLASGDTIFSSEPVTNNWARDVGNMSYDPIELACQIVLQNEEN